MSDHGHYQTLKGSMTLLPGLVVILLLEIGAGFFAGQLAVNAHSFDVLSDVLAFVIVIVGSGFSGLLDDHGRVHRETHREQKAIAFVNLAVLWIGAGLVMLRSVASFSSADRNDGFTGWWVVLGPLLAIVVYRWVGKRLHKISARDLTTKSLDIHVKADVYVSVLATGLTFGNLVFESSWINPVGGIVMSLVLFYISLELLAHILLKDSKV